jgi:hypothetical protein
MRADGHPVSTSTVQRALRRRGLLLPRGFRADRSPGPRCGRCSRPAHRTQPGPADRLQLRHQVLPRDHGHGPRTRQRRLSIARRGRRWKPNDTGGSTPPSDNTRHSATRRQDALPAAARSNYDRRNRLHGLTDLGRHLVHDLSHTTQRLQPKAGLRRTPASPPSRPRRRPRHRLVAP